MNCWPACSGWVGSLCDQSAWALRNRLCAWPFYRLGAAVLAHFIGLLQPIAKQAAIKLWLALIVLMTLFAVRMNVLFSFWYNGFYTAMQNLEAKAFWFMLLVFAVLATIHVGRAPLLQYYLQQAFSIRWRIWLTRVLIERWMERQGYYRSQYVAENADNPDQRIQQDVENFVDELFPLRRWACLTRWCRYLRLASFCGICLPICLFLEWIFRGQWCFWFTCTSSLQRFCTVKIGRPLIALNF